MICCSSATPSAGKTAPVQLKLWTLPFSQILRWQAGAFADTRNPITQSCQNISRDCAISAQYGAASRCTTSRSQRQAVQCQKNSGKTPLHPVRANVFHPIRPAISQLCAAAQVCHPPVHRTSIAEAIVHTVLYFGRGRGAGGQTTTSPS